TTAMNERTKMQLPSASTSGSFCGKRSWLQMNMGRVASLPERKEARTYSSSDSVKESSRLDTTPGSASGKVTRQNVPQALSPRSSEASSRLLSKPSRREISTRMENGVQISTWPAPTVQSDRSTSKTLRRTTRLPTPRMMEGTTSG